MTGTPETFRQANVARSARHFGAVLLCCYLTCADSADAPNSAAPPPAEPVDVEVFRAPMLKSEAPMFYPLQLQESGVDGWVILNMMIDPQGKPYEITVADSTGSPGLERAAIRTLEKFVFWPATRAGSPIDSSAAIRFNYALDSKKTGASLPFVRVYRSVTDAVKAGDQARADLEMPKLKAKTLYEDAYRSLALYTYHGNWGTEAQQLADLRRITAGSDSAKFLPPQTYQFALASTFKLQVQLSDFGGALRTWELLRPRAPPDELPALQRAVDQILALRKSDGVVSLAGNIGPRSSWHAVLFKRRFEVRVASGSVSEIKLRCEKGYVLFAYQAGITYDVKAGEGECGIEIVGDPETAFALVQS